MTQPAESPVIAPDVAPPIVDPATAPTDPAPPEPAEPQTPEQAAEAEALKVATERQAKIDRLNAVSAAARETARAKRQQEAATMAASQERQRLWEQASRARELERENERLRGKPDPREEAFRQTPEYRLEQQGRELAALRNEIGEERRVIALAKAEEQFVKTVANEELYPTLAELPPSLVLNAAKAIMLERQRQTGRYPSDEDVLEELEETYASHKARGTKLQTPRIESPSATAKTSSAPSRTLTASLNGSASLKTDTSNMTAAQWDEWAMTEAERLDKKA